MQIPLFIMYVGAVVNNYICQYECADYAYLFYSNYSGNTGYQHKTLIALIK